MDSVEIVVFLGIAVLVGGLVIMAVGRFDAIGMYDRIKGVFSPAAPAFTKATNATLPPLLFKAWEECGLGTQPKNLTFQYTGAPTDKQGIFAAISRNNLCDTFSSASSGCGKSEDLNLTEQIVDGRVYQASCDPATRQLVIS